MKILFKNKTRYTKQIYKEFLEFHQEKYGATYMGYTVLLIILFIFCIILQIQSRNYLLSILTLCILIGFVFWRLYNPIKTVQKEIQSEKIENQQEFIFKFYERKFIIYGKKMKSEIKYWKLYKIFETDDYFYLYIDKDHAFLLSKNGFEIGTPNSFREFIKRKCRFKFKKEL